MHDLVLSDTCLGEGFSSRVFLGTMCKGSSTMRRLARGKRATHHEMATPVAVKVFRMLNTVGEADTLPPEGPSETATHEMLRNELLEARLHARLEHRNLVRLLGVQEARQPVMLALEYCEHGNLLRMLRVQGARAGAEQQRDMAAQVAAGLAYLHANLCVHRDVAARNVLVADGGLQPPPCGHVLKLADLGLSRQLRPESDYYRVRRGRGEAGGAGRKCCRLNLVI